MFQFDDIINTQIHDINDKVNTYKFFTIIHDLIPATRFESPWQIAKVQGTFGLEPWKQSRR